MTVPMTDYIFHVHTYRCGHAENIPDEEYVKRAVDIQADSIWFTDHAPFPGDPFGNRMKYKQLPEYLSSMNDLKNRYKGIIEVHTGLEIEYFPSYDKAGYYTDLLKMKGLEFLMLGQHMAETETGRYTYDWDTEKKEAEEYIAIADAEIEGMKTGFFTVIAHPDRGFKRCRQWTEKMDAVSRQIIDIAVQNNVILEQNAASIEKKNNYRPEFWNTADESMERIIGLDAHSMTQIRLPEAIASDKEMQNKSGMTLSYFMSQQTIKRLRKKMHMSQSEFADYFRIPSSTVKDWEQGRRTPPHYVLRMMCRLAERNDHI